MLPNGALRTPFPFECRLTLYRSKAADVCQFRDLSSTDVLNRDADLDIIDYPELPQRERILKIAAQLFAHQGYHAVGMSDLQQAVGLGRGALYHHIRAKEDLLYDILREYIRELAETAEAMRSDKASPQRRIEMLGQHLVRKIASHQAEFTVCFRELNSLTAERHAEVVGYHARYERVWREAIVQGAEKGVFRPYDHVVFKAVMGMYFYSYLWIHAHRAHSVDAAANQLVELTKRMLKK